MFYLGHQFCFARKLKFAWDQQKKIATLIDVAVCTSLDNSNIFVMQSMVKHLCPDIYKNTQLICIEMTKQITKHSLETVNEDKVFSLFWKNRCVIIFFPAMKAGAIQCPTNVPLISTANKCSTAYYWSKAQTSSR